MRKSFALIFIIPFFSCGQSSLSNNGWSKVGLKGEVEEMSSKTYKAVMKNGEVAPKESNQLHYKNIVFDTAGNIIESYTQDYNWMYIATYKKNSGDLLYNTNPLIGSQGGIDTVIYSNGKADSVISKDKKGIIYNTTKLILDKDGNIIKRVKRDNSGKIIEIINSTYKNGVVIEETVLDGDKNPISKMEASFDKNNNALIVRIYNDKEDLLYAKYEYLDFDDHDNWTKSIEYNKEGKPFSITLRGFMYFKK